MDDELDVLDLPQIHTKPSSKSLLDALELLQIGNRSWNTKQTSDSKLSRRHVNPAGAARYLTSIISSDLGWLEDEEQKANILDTAAARFAERSGRTGRGALTREFRVPYAIRPSGLDGRAQEVTIQIHEPGLTGDNLGLKTWAASYVLARKWPTLLEEVPALRACQEPRSHGLLELGAGTGLVGLAAAVVLHIPVVLTDLPEIVPNLERNAQVNIQSLGLQGSPVRVAVLDWSQPDVVSQVGSDSNEQFRGERWSVIVAADPIYSEEHARLLVEAIEHNLSKASQATFIVSLPIRDAYTHERAELRTRLADIGLELIKDETDTGVDDWGDDENPEQVICNTMVWQRRQP